MFICWDQGLGLRSAGRGRRTRCLPRGGSTWGEAGTGLINKERGSSERPPAYPNASPHACLAGVLAPSKNPCQARMCSKLEVSFTCCCAGGEEAEDEIERLLGASQLEQRLRRHAQRALPPLRWRVVLRRAPEISRLAAACSEAGVCAGTNQCPPAFLLVAQSPGGARPRGPTCAAALCAESSAPEKSFAIRSRSHSGGSGSGDSARLRGRRSCSSSGIGIAKVSSTIPRTRSSPEPLVNHRRTGLLYKI